MQDHLRLSAVSSELLRTVETAFLALRSLSDSQAARPRAAGKWSAKQIIGHLIDSAANNHHRFVRAQEGLALTFPAYDQDHWVSCQHYDRRDWADLTGLWQAYNRHLAHIIDKIPDDQYGVPCTIGTDTPITLGFLAHDYVVHLQHHLAQVSAGSRTEV